MKNLLIISQLDARSRIDILKKIMKSGIFNFHNFTKKYVGHLSPTGACFLFCWKSGSSWQVSRCARQCWFSKRLWTSTLKLNHILLAAGVAHPPKNEISHIFQRKYAIYILEVQSRSVVQSAFQSRKKTEDGQNLKESERSDPTFPMARVKWL